LELLSADLKWGAPKVGRTHFCFGGRRVFFISLNSPKKVAFILPLALKRLHLTNERKDYS
jgi:hypothetical protein